MQDRFRHVYPVTVSGFWEGMFFDPGYNESLYTEGLGFDRMVLLADEVAADGLRHRRIQVWPRLDMPRPVRRIVGDRMSYVEECIFDPGPATYTTRLVLSRAADLISIETTTRCEPLGEDRCTRVVDVSYRVRIPIVGRIIEAYIGKTLRENYEKATDFTQRWLAARVD